MGFKEADIHDSKFAENKIAKRIGSAMREFFIPFKKLKMSPKKNRIKPTIPVFIQIVRYEL